MAAAHRSPTRRRPGPAAGPWALLACLVLGALASGVAAQSATGDAGADPLAWRRLDAGASDRTLTVDDRASGRTRTVSGRRLLQGSQELYLRSATVADILQAGRLWQAVSRQLTLQVAGASVRCTEGSRLVSLGDREALLPVPVVYHEGDLWLPLVLITRIVAPQAGLAVRWQPEDRRLVVGQSQVNLTDLRVSELTRATSVHLIAREPLSFRASSPEPGRIEVKVYGARADLGRVRQETSRGLVEGARTRQADDHAVVTVRVSDLVSRYRTYTLQEGREIVLVVEEEQVSALPDPVPRGRAELALAERPVDVTRQLEIRTVVIDPGHGGGDPGVAGVGGLLEKDINLAIGREVARYLRRQDLEVVLTREEDVHLGLAERAEIANAAGGDIFVSLHCNGWFNEGARGLETYFLSPAKSDWTKSVEALENRGHPEQEPEDVEFIVWDLVQNRYISASSDLAEVIQAGVVQDLGLPDRGVRQAGFRVLVGAWMPAVLVELGFLSHPQEARQLASPSYQTSLARALGDAILDYRDRTARAVAQDGGGRPASETERR
jgi:N-acetylmuramoyl-L-alanine amidase